MSSKSSEYPSFNFKGEKIIIIPGSHFSKNELKTRLKEIGLKEINNQQKDYLSKLYDSLLCNENNRLKLIQLLRKDTNNMNSNLAKSQRQSMPANINISNNSAQYRVMNISNEIQSLYPGSREQQINLVRPIHTNKGKYAQNPFISGNFSQNFNYDNSYNNEINNKNKYNDNINSFNPNSNYMSVNSELKMDNVKNKNNFMNNTYNVSIDKNNLSNISKKNNNSSFLSDINNLFKNRGSKQYEEDNSDRYNNNYINNRLLRNKPPFEEEKIYTNEIRDSQNNIPNNSYNNDQCIQEFHESKNLDLDNLDTTPDGNNYKKPSKRLTYQPDSLKNDIYSNNTKKRKTLNNMQHSLNINEMPYNSVMQNISTNSNNNINESNNENKEEKIYIQNKKEPDEVSTYSAFSFFSAFENFKKYPFYKNRKFILIHLLILLAILCIAISLFKMISNSWDNIVEFFSGSKEILDSMLSYIYSLILYPVNYWYVSIPIIVVIFVLYLIMRKYLFKKRCEEIYERIVRDLENDIENESRSISEEEICRRYSRLYGINYNRFLNKYLPQIRKLRRSDKNNRLKLSAINDNDKDQIYWRINE